MSGGGDARMLSDQRPGLRDDARYRLRELSSQAVSLSSALDRLRADARRFQIEIDDILGEDYQRKFADDKHWWQVWRR